MNGRSGADPAGTHPDRPGDEEDHARHGADRRLADRQGPAARARRRAVLGEDHRGRARPRRRRRRAGLAAARRPRRGALDGLRRRSAPTAACAAATTPASSVPPRARSRPTSLAGKQYQVIPVGRKAEGYFRFRGYDARRGLRRVQRQPDPRRRQAHRRPRRRAVHERRGRPGRARVHPLHQRRQPGGRAAAARAAVGGDRRRRRRQAGRGRRPDAATTSSSPTRRRSSRRCCRATSRPACTPPCSTPRRPSTPSASGR